MVLSLARLFPEKNTLRAPAVLALMILLVFGNVAFLGRTLSPALNSEGVLVGKQYGYEGPLPTHSTELDPLAVGGQNWPVLQLVARTFLGSRIPLWNPYQGTGAPLAADTSWSTYFPVDFLYSIVPNVYWDFVALFKIWLAAIFCFLLLKRLGLGELAATGGAFAYSLSGAFVVNSFAPWTDVALMTPLLLLLVKRCFDKPGMMSMGMTAIAALVSLLGAHIESLIIQFLFVGWFTLFEAMTGRGARIRGAAVAVLGIIVGFGLAAFFLAPVFEYLLISTASRGAGVGLYSPSSDGKAIPFWVTLFVPYFYGFLQTYPSGYVALRQVFSWDIFPGYIGTTVFFLSLLPILSWRTKWRDPRWRYFGFFILSEIIVLMKVFGIPPINWLGYVPVLTYIIFPRYLASVLAISFAGACAFGLETVLSPSRRNSALTCFVVILALLPAVWATIPSPVSPTAAFFPVSLAYLAFSMLALISAAVIAARGGKLASTALVSLILLELTAYLPWGLTYRYEAAKAMILAAGLIAVGLTVALKDLNLRFRRVQLRTKSILAIVLVTALVLQFSISSVSPQGLPSRYDPFTAAPYVRFLEANSGIQRVYSPDGIFFPPVAGVFSVQNLGEFSAFMPSSFHDFVSANLDRGAISTTFVGNGWSRNDSIDVVHEIRTNLPFYSLLGVKYFVTSQSDLSIANQTLLQQTANASTNWAPIGAKVVQTRFVSSFSFDGLYLRLGAISQPTSGDVVVTIDEVGGAAIHRDSRVSAASFPRGGLSLFKFDRINLTRSTEFDLTVSQSDTGRGNEAGVMGWSSVIPNPNLQVAPGFPLLALGLTQRDPGTASYLLIVYQDQNATIYQNLNVYPRAFLIGGFIIAPNDTVAINETHSLGWDTSHIAVLEAPNLPILNSTQVETGSVNITNYSSDQVTMRFNALQPSILVLTDTYYPGWHAYLDGIQKPIYRAYGTVRAVIIRQAGEHALVFRYEPESFRVGTFVSGISLVVLLALLVASILRKEHTGVAREGRRFTVVRDLSAQFWMPSMPGDSS